MRNEDSWRPVPKPGYPLKRGWGPKFSVCRSQEYAKLRCLVLLHLRYQQPVGEAARRLPASNELRNDGSRSWLRRWDKGTWARQKAKAANLRIPNQEIRNQALHMGFSENIMPPNPLVNDWLTISFPTHGAWIWVNPPFSDFQRHHVTPIISKLHRHLSLDAVPILCHYTIIWIGENPILSWLSPYFGWLNPVKSQ